MSGVIAAEADNGNGVAGACWDCPFAVARTFVQASNEAAYSDVAEALNFFISMGVPIVNFSAGLEDESCAASGFLSIMCSALGFASSRNILFIAAAGNDNRNSIHFPAIEDDTISVGGVQLDDPGAMEYSRWIHAPFGSNYSDKLDLVAPSPVLSTAYHGKTWSQGLDCGDGPYIDHEGSGTNGVGPCEGTSLAAPHISGAVALLLSLNRELSAAEIRDILKSTASHALTPNEFLGSGIPDVNAASAKALGAVSGEVVPTRVTALYKFYSDFDQSYFYTTVPTTASAAVFDMFDSEGPLVTSLERFPGSPCVAPPCPLDDNLPRASMFILTTDARLSTEYPDTIPLYRMRKDPNLANRCVTGGGPRIAGKKFAFASSAGEIALLQNQGYVLDTTEGYIFGECSEPGCVIPEGTEVVYRLFNSTTGAYGLFLASELPQPGFGSVVGLEDAVGRAYPNIDSDHDRLINGFEKLLKTSPFASDSDCDGVDDGDEFLVYDMTNPNPLSHGYSDPSDGPCGAIFTDGFESGNAANWSSFAG